MAQTDDGADQSKEAMIVAFYMGAVSLEEMRDAFTEAELERIQSFREQLSDGSERRDASDSDLKVSAASCSDDFA